MGHFALVDENIVRNVITINNTDLDDLPFPESEPVGQAFIATLPDLAIQAGTWWECSYNNNFRGVYPGLGYGFDGVNFIPPAEPEPELIADDYTTQPEPVIEAP